MRYLFMGVKKPLFYLDIFKTMENRIGNYLNKAKKSL